MSSTLRERPPSRKLRRVLSVTNIQQNRSAVESISSDTITVNLDTPDSLPILDLTSLPLVASMMSILLILIYNLAERWGIIDEGQISVTWRQVVTKREVWRLLIAHYFHFSRVQFVINVTSLMALGRYLEKKIQPIPMLLLIVSMGSIANVFHMVLCTYICDDPDNHSTTGFSQVVFALKMIQVLSKDAGKRRGPTLLMGVVPVYLGSFAPWEPLFEGVLSDVLIKGKHFATHVSGILAGLCFPIIDYFWHDYILVTPRCHETLTFSASSGSQGEVNRCLSKSSSEEQLGRVMRVLKEDEYRIPLFHQLPSNTECVLLFHRHQPMKETSVHNQYKSKSDSVLLVKGKRD